MKHVNSSRGPIEFGGSKKGEKEREERRKRGDASAL